MSKKTEEANQRAFERGQSDWQEGKAYNKSNPYPPESSYYDYWNQGWEAENDIHHK